VRGRALFVENVWRELKMGNQEQLIKLMTHREGSEAVQSLLPLSTSAQLYRVCRYAIPACYQPLIAAWSSTVQETQQFEGACMPLAVPQWFQRTRMACSCKALRVILADAHAAVFVKVCPTIPCLPFWAHLSPAVVSPHASTLVQIRHSIDIISLSRQCHGIKTIS
jgi:hypothetical protein